MVCSSPRSGIRGGHGERELSYESRSYYRGPVKGEASLQTIGLTELRDAVLRGVLQPEKHDKNTDVI